MLVNGIVVIAEPARVWTDGIVIDRRMINGFFTDSFEVRHQDRVGV
jgi:hypothetical protein